MKIKLIYFNQPFWRAEVARLPLFMSNIEFEDFRITDEDLRYLKANGKLKDGTSIPFRQLPVLVVDGHSIAQSGGIARICGKLSGMYSENIIEAGKVDQIIEMPVQNITNCVFGGKDMKTLFITTASNKGENKNDLDGSLFAINLNYQGLEDNKSKLELS